MSDSNQPVVFSCPNCGSSIAMNGPQGTCAYCGTAIERPNRWQATINASNGIPRARRASSGGRRGVHPILVLLLVVLAAAGGFVGGQVRQAAPLIALPGGNGTGQQASPEAPVVRLDEGSFSELATVLPIDGPGGDPLVYLYHSGENGKSIYTVARIDGATQKTRWQSPPLSSDAYQGALAAGSTMVYFTDKEKLMALHLNDGTVAWQTTLDVEPQNGCEECLRVVGERVLVLEKNGGLQAFDAASGQAAWQTRLDDTPRDLPLVGNDRVLVLHSGADKSKQVLAFLDAVSGKTTREIEPQCPRAHDNFSEERPGWGTPFLFDAEGTTMITMYGFFTQCAQRWNLTTGEPTWQVPLDDGLVPASWSTGELLQTPDAVFVGNDKLLWALNTADGTTRTLVDDKENNLTPVAFRNGVLIVLASPTWDSQRQILWGLDAQTGERKWERKLDTHEWAGGSSFGDFDVHFTRAGLTIVQTLGDDEKLVVETLDPKTGTSVYRQENALSDMGSPSLRGVNWGDDTAWVQINSDAFAVDLATGKVVYRLR